MTGVGIEKRDYVGWEIAEETLEVMRGLKRSLDPKGILRAAFNNASGAGTNSESQFGAGDNAYCMITPRHIGTQQIALRYQSLRGQHGPKVVCRLLNVDLEQPTRTYEELGYSESHCDLLRHAAHIPAGFLLFAGITGSGKTTTLKTYIETHPQNGSAAFYSIEDPVEYPLRGVHQINLQRDLIDRAGSAAKYAEVVAGLMRADPDGVLMGEIRDPASAISGQQIVETGHMAAGTVHAHLISSISPRLKNDEIGMSRQTLTNPMTGTTSVHTSRSRELTRVRPDRCAAAPVLVGICDIVALRARRRSEW